jgi:hypothetical protein
MRTQLLARKKLNALRIFKHPTFRRKIPSPIIVQKAITLLKKNLVDTTSFARLTKPLPGRYGLSSVRLFEFKGAELAIKYSGGLDHQGYSKNVKSNGIRKFIKAHHALFRKQGLRTKVNYILRTPRLFGVVNKFLVMEKIPRWTPKTPEEINAFLLAQEQLEDSFQNLAASKWIQKPQVTDFIPTGMYKEKVVFYAVYDYV